MANQQPTPSPTLDSGPVTCKGCGREFANFVVEEIAGVLQLRNGDLLIFHLEEAACIHCGWIFRWNIREKDVSKTAQLYGRILSRLEGKGSNG